MSWPVVKKARRADLPPPNLVDYEEARRSFTWEAARAALDGLPGGRGINIAHEAVDRHGRHGRGGDVAVRFLREGRVVEELTYEDLKEQTSRFAGALGRLGVGRGDRVFGLLGRVPALCVACLGTLKAGLVLPPLFSPLGPDPILQRLEIGDARVLVTTSPLYRRKAAGLRAALRSCSWCSPTGLTARRQPAALRSTTSIPTSCSGHRRSGLGHGHLVWDRRSGHPRHHLARRRGRARRRPLPGVEAAAAARAEDGSLVLRDGEVERVEAPWVHGELVLRPGWESMFRGYLHDEAGHAAVLVAGWYAWAISCSTTRTATSTSSVGATT